MLYNTNTSSRITHNVMSLNPFTVQFIHSNGSTVIEKYAIVLTNEEIKAEYDYITFPVNRFIIETE